MLREAFGRRVRRAAYTRSATAIGLAIQADAEAGYTLRERFGRFFGVWREAEAGCTVIFDAVFPKGTRLPDPGDAPVVSTRQYCPVHNIGHFRYLECSHLDEAGQPAGDISFWDEIRFPFDASLRDQADLGSAHIFRTEGVLPLEVEERYACHPDGTVTVSIKDLSDGYSREYKLGRWAATRAVLVPGRKKKMAASR